LPPEVEADSVDFWFQDEARVGQQGSLTRIWAPKGTRPRKVQQRQFISSYIYGAACPGTGESFGLILPYANTSAMNTFLQDMSLCLSEGRHVGLIVDNAGWHRSNELSIPSNITLIPLPPYSPELNAMEQVWDWIKSHYLDNHSFKDYKSILDFASTGWNAFSDNTNLVKSICHRKWLKL